MARNIGHDDYSLSRVPMEGKQATWKVTMVRLGGISCLPILMLGAQLGNGMKFWDAFIAVVLGSVILQIVGWSVGRAAAKEGLSTSLFSRWSGFGNIGSSVIGVVIAISSFGWFGIQNSVFAGGLLQITGVFNFQIWAIITGIGTTLIVIYGFKLMSLVANIALPLFAAGVIYAFVVMLQGHDVNELTTAAPVGDPISMPIAITMVSGAYMVGAVITPDMSRFIAKEKNVFWMVLISTFVGEIGFCTMGSMLAHAAGTADVVTIMYTISGALGVALVIFSTLKINDINLYSSSLGIINFLNSLFKVKPHRGTATLFMGIFGTILSLLGILDFFIGFLTFLGVLIPPICGIMIVDYYVLKRHRKVLDESKGQNGILPKKVEIWNPIAIIAWAAASVFGYFFAWGIPALNSLILSFVLYLVLMKIMQGATKKTEFAEMDFEQVEHAEKEAEKE